MTKINKTPLEPSSQDIKKLRVDLGEERLCFSFKYLKGDDFAYKDHESAYFIELIKRLKAYSGLTFKEITSSSNPSIRCHRINWNDSDVTKDCFDFPLEDKIVDEPYQLNVSANKYGRIHGFFIGNIFFIVWLDKDHKLYSAS